MKYLRIPSFAVYLFILESAFIIGLAGSAMSGIERSDEYTCSAHAKGSRILGSIQKESPLFNEFLSHATHTSHSESCFGSALALQTHLLWSQIPKFDTRTFLSNVPASVTQEIQNQCAQGKYESGGASYSSLHKLKVASAQAETEYQHKANAAACDTQPATGFMNSLRNFGNKIISTLSNLTGIFGNQTQFFNDYTIHVEELADPSHLVIDPSQEVLRHFTASSHPQPLSLDICLELVHGKCIKRENLTVTAVRSFCCGAACNQSADQHPKEWQVLMPDASGKLSPVWLKASGLTEVLTQTSKSHLVRLNPLPGRNSQDPQDFQGSKNDHSVKGNYPIHYAAKAADHPFIKNFVQNPAISSEAKAAALNARDLRGVTALCAELSHIGANPELVQILLQGGTNLMKACDSSGNFPIHLIAQQNTPAALEILKHFKDHPGMSDLAQWMNQKNPAGQTALDLAVGSDNIGVVDWLLSHQAKGGFETGENSSSQGNPGLSPAHLAVERFSIDLNQVHQGRDLYMDIQHSLDNFFSVVKANPASLKVKDAARLTPIDYLLKKNEALNQAVRAQNIKRRLNHFGEAREVSKLPMNALIDIVLERFKVQGNQEALDAFKDVNLLNSPLCRIFSNESLSEREIQDILEKEGLNLGATCDPYGNTAFHLLSSSDDIKLTEKFLKALNNSSRLKLTDLTPFLILRNSSGDSALDVAVAKDKESQVSWILSNTVNGAQNSSHPVHHETTFVSVVKDWIHLEREIENGRSDNQSLAKTKLKIIEHFLKAGAKVTEVNRLGNRVLDQITSAGEPLAYRFATAAIGADRADILEALTRKQGSLFTAVDENDNLLLHHSVGQDKIRTSTYLIKKQYEYDQRNSSAPILSRFKKGVKRLYKKVTGKPVSLFDRKNGEGKRPFESLTKEQIHPLLAASIEEGNLVAVNAILSRNKSHYTHALGIAAAMRERKNADGTSVHYNSEQEKVLRYLENHPQFSYLNLAKRYLSLKTDPNFVALKDHLKDGETLIFGENTLSAGQKTGKPGVLDFILKTERILNQDLNAIGDFYQNLSLANVTQLIKDGFDGDSPFSASLKDYQSWANDANVVQGDLVRFIDKTFQLSDNLLAYYFGSMPVIDNELPPDSPATAVPHLFEMINFVQSIPGQIGEARDAVRLAYGLIKRFEVDTIRRTNEVFPHANIYDLASFSKFILKEANTIHQDILSKNPFKIAAAVRNSLKLKDLGQELQMKFMVGANAELLNLIDQAEKISTKARKGAAFYDASYEHKKYTEYLNNFDKSIWIFKKKVKQYTPSAHSRTSI